MNLFNLAGGNINAPDKRNNFDIKITAVGNPASGEPVPHGWKRVIRTPDHKWIEMSENGSLTVDPAYEYQNAKATVGDIRPAYRHPGTNEVLFFLRKKAQSWCGPDGVCALQPKTITVTFPTFASPPAQSPPVYAIQPGGYSYETASPNCITSYFPDGLTRHYDLFKDKLKSLVPSGQITLEVPASGSASEISFDMTNSISGYLPKLSRQNYDDINNPLPNGCPGPGALDTYNTIIQTAKYGYEIQNIPIGNCGGYYVKIKRKAWVELSCYVQFANYLQGFTWGKSPNGDDSGTFSGFSPTINYFIEQDVFAEYSISGCATTETVETFNAVWTFE